MSLIQINQCNPLELAQIIRFGNPWATVLVRTVLAEIAAMRLGASWAMDCPFSQLSDQKRVRFPLPTWICTEALKKVFTSGSTWIRNADHNLSLPVLCSHSQCVRRANPASLKSITPSPPKFVGRQTVGQAIAFLLWTAESVPVQKKIPSDAVKFFDHVPRVAAYLT